MNNKSKKESEMRGGMFREESAGWLACIGVMGVYVLGLFGFNGWRAACDGHWAVVPVLGVGAIVGLVMAAGAVMEGARRLR